MPNAQSQRLEPTMATVMMKSNDPNKTQTLRGQPHPRPEEWIPRIWSR